MPKHEQSIPLQNTDIETALALSYEAMKNLGWTVEYASDTQISGNTPKTWKSNAQQILVGVKNEKLTISSEMVNGESFDMGGKNKKNVAVFLQAFVAVKANENAIKIDDNKAAIDTLRAATIQDFETEMQTTAAVNEAMNLHSGNLYVTYTLMAINVLIFIVMLIDGAGIMGENGLVHIKWGANYAPLTLTGDWWRLVTSTFLHFGIIHVGMNMYCLYTIGVYLEPMLGKPKYLTAYLCTGVFASLVSLWWHKTPVISAGASGAVFGMFGLFLALLTTNLIPKQVRQSLLQSIGIFIAFNLFYGMKGGIDNSAHVGGLVSGFVVGYLYVYCIKKEKIGQKLVWVIPALLLLTAGAAYVYLQQNKGDSTLRKQIKSEVKDASYKDNDKFQQSLKSFDELHNSARSFFNDTALTDKQYAIKINEIAKPAWEKAEVVLIATKGYDISPQSHTKAERLLEYITIRRKELEILQRLFANVNDHEALLAQLKEVRAKADSVFKSALEL